MDKIGNHTITFQKCVELVIDAIDHQNLVRADFLLDEVYYLYMAGNPPHTIIKLLRRKT